MTEGLVVMNRLEIDHYASDMNRTFPVKGGLGEAEERLFEIGSPPRRRRERR